MGELVKESTCRQEAVSFLLKEKFITLFIGGDQQRTVYKRPNFILIIWSRPSEQDDIF